MYTIGGQLYHHGVLGMKWGVRRYQPYSQGYQPKGKGGKYINNSKKGLTDKQKTIIKNGAIIAGSALAIIGTAYVGSKVVSNLDQKAIKMLTDEVKEKAESYYQEYMMYDKSAQKYHEMANINRARGNLKNANEFVKVAEKETSKGTKAFKKYLNVTTPNPSSYTFKDKAKVLLRKR